MDSISRIKPITRHSSRELLIVCAVMLASMASVLLVLHPLLVPAIILCAICIAILANPAVGVFILIATTPFISIASMPIFSFGGQNAPLTANDLLIPLTISSWLLRRILNRNLGIDRVVIWVGAFVLVDIISLSFNISKLSSKEFLIASMYLIRWIEYALLYMVVRDTFRSEKEIKSLLYAFIGSGVLVALLGFIQLILFPNMSQIVAIATSDVASLQGLDPHQQRLVSVFLEPNHLAGYFIIFTAALLSLAVVERNRRTKLVWLVSSVLVLTAMALTQSRAGFIGLATAGLFMSKSKNRKPILIALGVIMIVVLLSPKTSSKLKGIFYSDSSSDAIVEICGIKFRPDGSAAARLGVWSDAGRTIAVNPVIGCGYNAYKFASARANNRQPSVNRGEAGAANSYLTLFATTGIIGLIAYLGIIFGMVRRFSKAAEKYQGTLAGALSFAVATSVIGLAIHATTIESLFFPQIMFAIWVLSGLASASIKLQAGSYFKMD